MDAGLSYRELRRRLDRLGVDVSELQAVVLTHGHGDQWRGADLLARRHGVTVYATPRTLKAWTGDDVACAVPIQPGQVLRLGALAIHPFTVPHDDVETLAFRIETPEGAIGFATDVGCVTAEFVARSRGCLLLVIEANHAAELLRVSPYAASVKARVGGDRGHLSNEALAAFIDAHLDASVRCLVLAHLSRVNNVPEIAEMTCRDALVRRGLGDVRIVMTYQDRPSQTIDLAEIRTTGAWLSTAPTARFRQDRLPFDAGLQSGLQGAVEP